MPKHFIYRAGEYKVVLQMGIWLWNAKILYFHDSRVYKITRNSLDMEDVIKEVESIIHIPYREWKRIQENGDTTQ